MGAYFLQLYPMHLPWSIASTSTSVDAPLVSQRSLEVPHISLPVLLLQDCQCLSVGAHVHLVRFRAANHHMWPLPCINVFHTSQLLASLGGYQLDVSLPQLRPSLQVWSIHPNLHLLYLERRGASFQADSDGYSTVS